MRSFKNLKIIEQGMQIVSATHQLNTQFSQTNLSGLIQEINLLAIGIPSIVAESSKQEGEAPYQQGLKQALNSIQDIESKLSTINGPKPALKAVESLLKKEEKLLEEALSALDTKEVKRPAVRSRLSLSDKSRPAISLRLSQGMQQELF